jgi:hypothetical protein
MEGQFVTGWDEQITSKGWLKELHPEAEIEAMRLETHDILLNFVKSVDKKLNEMVTWKIYRNKQQAWNSVAPKYSEKWVKSNQYAIIGIVDAVCNDFDGGTTLLDYKTSKRYGAYLPEDYYRQLIIYAFLYTLEMGEMPNFVGVNYLRFDDTFYVKVNQGVLDEAKEIIMFVHDALKERMEDEEAYEQKPQNLCKWCSFYKGNGGTCDVQIPKWKPKFGSSTKKKYAKAENAVFSDADVQLGLSSMESDDTGDKNTVWDD